MDSETVAGAARKRMHLFLLICAILSVLPRCASQTLAINESGDLSLGGWYELRCSTKSFEQKKLNWEKNDVELTSPAAVNQNNPSVSLMLSPLKQSDAGKYSCLLTGNDGTLFASLPLTLVIPPPQITVSVTNSTQQQALSFGDTVTLTCLVLFPKMLLGSVASIQWTHGGSPVSAEANTNLTSGSSVLTITLSTLAGAGEYMCTTSVSSPYLDLISVSKTASGAITLQAPASTSYISPSETAPFIAGTSLNLHCIVSATLQGGFNLTTDWLMNGSLLTNSNDGRIQIDELHKAYQNSYVTSVVMNTVSKMLDRGTYTCRTIVSSAASNYILPSESTPMYHLDIQAPSPTISVTPRSITIPKNYDISLVCTVTTSKDLVVDKVFTWTSYSANSTDSVSSSSNSQVKGTSNTFTVNLSTPGTYIFACLVTINVPGDEPVTAQDNSTVTVPSKTIQLNITTSGSSLAGELYELTCIATDTLIQFLGLPKIYWTRDGDNVTSNTGQGIEVGKAMEINGFVSQSLILSPLRQSHAGQYHCVAVLHEETADVQKTVEVFAPSSSVSLSSSAGQTPLLGSAVALFCIVSFPATLNGTTGSIQWMYKGVPITTSEIHTNLMGGNSTLVFNSISATSGGNYTCIAEIASPFVETSFYSDSLTITVQLPGVSKLHIQPHLPPPFIAGTQLKLTYTFRVSSQVKTDGNINISSQWLKNESQLASLEDNRIQLTDLYATDIDHNTGTYTYTGSITISPVSLTLDSVSFSCVINITSNVSNVLPSTTMAPYLPLISASDLSVSLTPELVRLPDNALFKNITFLCIATVPQVLEVDKVFTWTKDLKNITINATSATNPKGMESSSILSVALSTAGIFCYTCTVTISVPGDPSISVSKKSTINVTVPSLPLEPGNLNTANITYKSAIVLWTVFEISYTAETYIVRYGMQDDQLTEASAPISGSMDFLATNQTMSVQLTGLQHLTQYFFVVEASNSEGTIQTVPSKFQTSELSAPLEPASFQMDTVNSSAVQFTWEAPLNFPSTGDINSYLLDCQPPSSTLPFPMTFPVGSLTATTDGMFVMTLSGFVPGTMYQCTLLATNPAGNGATAISSALTVEEAPGSPPSNVIVSSLGSSTILISWGPPQIPNGQISLYFLHFDYNNGSTDLLDVPGTKEEWIVEGLSPFQLVSVRMSAATKFGEGPLGDYVSIRTNEEVPDAVEGIMFSFPNSSVLVVAFPNPPLSAAHGIIICFKLSIELYPKGNQQKQNVIALPNATQYSVSFSNLRGLVPYTVSLSAVNSAGEGETNSTIIFTEEGIPPPPVNVRGVRVNDTHMNISWSPIPLTESNGFILSYVIYYRQLPSNKRQSGSTTIEGHQSYGIVGGLAATIQYDVSVKASTSAGLSENSEVITVLSMESGIFLSDLLIVVVASSGVGAIFLLLIFIVGIAIIATACKKRKKRDKVQIAKNDYEEDIGIELASCDAYGSRATPPPLVDEYGHAHVYDSIDRIRRNHVKERRALSKAAEVFENAKFAGAGNCYNHPNPTTSLPTHQIRSMYNAPNSHKEPLNGTIPEDLEKSVYTEQAYDVIRTDNRSGEHYDVPKSGACWQSPERRYGDVTNPCYATSRQESQQTFYDVPKNQP